MCINTLNWDETLAIVIMSDGETSKTFPFCNNKGLKDWAYDKMWRLIAAQSNKIEHMQRVLFAKNDTIAEANKRIDDLLDQIDDLSED